MTRTLAVFACLFGLASAQDKPVPEWLQKDVEVAKRVAAALPPGDLTVADFLKKLGEIDREEDQDIGFGARRIQLSISGDSATILLAMIAHGDRIGPVVAQYRELEAKT